MRRPVKQSGALSQDTQYQSNDQHIQRNGYADYFDHMSGSDEESDDPNFPLWNDEPRARRKEENAGRTKRNDKKDGQSRFRHVSRRNHYRRDFSPTKVLRKGRRKSKEEYIDPNYRNNAWQGFFFKPRREKLDWRVISRIDIDQLMDSVDIDTLESITKNLTFSRIEAKGLC